MGVPVTVVTDNMPGYLLSKGIPDVFICAADVVTLDGYVVNKIGTYQLAVLARAHGIPFYIAAPRSTFDFRLEDGTGIPIEERSADELPTAAGAQVYNPAFDVTPAELIAGFITDDGILQPPFDTAIHEFANR